MGDPRVWVGPESHIMLYVCRGRLARKAVLNQQGQILGHCNLYLCICQQEYILFTKKDTMIHFHCVQGGVVDPLH